MTGTPSQQALDDYDYYFTQCEKANIRPLTFEAWANKQQKDNEL